jgi:hypothetical protein
MMNTLKRELYKQQSDLLVDHQQEDLIDGGSSSSVQFHYLLKADSTALASTTTAAGAFDANTGTAGSLTPAATAFGTSEYEFETRRDFDYDARGF